MIEIKTYDIDRSSKYWWWCNSLVDSARIKVVSKKYFGVKIVIAKYLIQKYSTLGKTIYRTRQVTKWEIIFKLFK